MCEIIRIFCNQQFSIKPLKGNLFTQNKLKIRYFRTTPQQADGVFARKFLPKAAKPRIF